MIKNVRKNFLGGLFGKKKEPYVLNGYGSHDEILKELKIMSGVIGIINIFYNNNNNNDDVIYVLCREIVNKLSSKCYLSRDSYDRLTYSIALPIINDKDLNKNFEKYVNKYASFSYELTYKIIMKLKEVDPSDYFDLFVKEYVKQFKIFAFSKK